MEKGKMEIEDESKKEKDEQKQKEKLEEPKKEEEKKEKIEQKEEKEEKMNIESNDQKEKKDQKESIEIFLKKKTGKISPTIFLEYPKTEDTSPLSKLDSENLKSFLIKFGKIAFCEIYRLIALVQYETFLSAYSCIKYFEKINMNKKEKEKIICRWFEEKDEEIINNDISTKIRKLKPYEIVENINKSMKNFYLKKKEKISNFADIQEDEENNIKENILTDSISQLEYYSLFTLSPNAQKEFNEMVTINKNRGIQNLESSTNQNNKDLNMIILSQANEKSNANIKYICKFYLQIEGDKEFQIVKRIIGAKGSNLKRIIDYCSKGPGGVYVPDAIKLKLKGVGSGYREREGDKKEPLNLCVISKYPDKYKKACSFVIELIINIYSEYKRFCERKGKKPINNLNIQKAEYISTRGY